MTPMRGSPYDVTPRAAFVCSGDPYDVTEWSGTPNNMLLALQRHTDVALVVRHPFSAWFVPFGRMLKAVTGRRFEYARSSWYVALAARRAIAEITKARPEVVYVVSSTIANELVDRFPVVYIADATMRAMTGYYDAMTRYSEGARISAEAIEARTLSRSLRVTYPSAWACQSAREDYGVKSEDVLEIAWGANLEKRIATPRTVEPGILKLLFVGIDWQRKGGPILLQAVEDLSRRGIAVQLDIVGCGPDVVNGAVPEGVTFHGFVSKSTPEGKALLDTLYARATLFVLPTKAECLGIVFAEAAHHGLPSVAFATGGVTSVVRNGETGILLPLGSRPDQFADVIADLTSDPVRYARMSLAAAADAHDRLDWDIWAEHLTTKVKEALTRRKCMESN